MNEDKLKDFINQNKDQFDEFEPGENAWNNIELKLDLDCEEKNKTRNKINNVFNLQTQVWRYAAAILLVMVVGMAAYIYTHPSQVPIGNIAVATKLTPELADAEFYYTSQIVSKQKELKNSCMSGYSTSDLSMLDSTYLQLKEELYKDVNNQQIANAMIQNLQIRMKILNEQIEMLKTVTKYQNTQNNRKKS